MAQRLATEYVKTCLVLAEAELLQLMQLFQNHQLTFKVKVLDNGDQQIVFANASETNSIVLTFERRLGKYVLNGGCRFTDVLLANAMRKAVSQFKGDAVVNRIYEYYTLEYRYRAGAVVRITERTKHGERLVYERKDTVGELVRAFEVGSAEREIRWVREEIDKLLDVRNQSSGETELRRIDSKLAGLSHRLFVLEA